MLFRWNASDMYAKNVVPFERRSYGHLRHRFRHAKICTQQFVILLKLKLLHYGASKVLESFHKLFKNESQNYFKEFQLYVRLQMDEKSLLPESIQNLILCFTCYVKCHNMFANCTFCLKLVSFRILSLKSRQEKP